MPGYTLGRQVVTFDRNFSGGTGPLFAYEEVSIPTSKVVMGAGSLVWRVGGQAFPNHDRWNYWLSQFNFGNGPSDDTGKWWFTTTVPGDFGDLVVYRHYVIVVNP